MSHPIVTKYKKMIKRHEGLVNSMREFEKEIWQFITETGQVQDAILEMGKHQGLGAEKPALAAVQLTDKHTELYKQVAAFTLHKDELIEQYRSYQALAKEYIDKISALQKRFDVNTAAAIIKTSNNYIAQYEKKIRPGTAAIRELKAELQTEFDGLAKLYRGMLN